MRRYLIELADRIGGRTADELAGVIGHRELVERLALDEVHAQERADAERDSR